MFIINWRRKGGQFLVLLNTDLFQQKIKIGDYDGALALCLDAVEENDPQLLAIILNNIRALISKGVKFSLQQLNRIKPLLGFYEEEISILSIEVYTLVLKKTPDLLSTELDFCLSKLEDFESTIRDRFIDYLIKIAPSQPILEEKILKGLAGRLIDNLWKIRIKIIEFFNNILKTQRDQIKPFKYEMLKILDEKDLDVARDGMDFLFRLVTETFSPEDVKQLVFSLPDKNWLAQEKILWLVSKIGRKRKDLIENIVPDLVNLLDFDDFLVQRKASTIIEEIMEPFPDLFDTTFFSSLEQEKIENVHEIERLLKESIHKIGYSRFSQLFNAISQKKTVIFRSFTNSFKSLILSDPTFGESILLNLMDELLENLTENNYEKLVEFLKSIPQYNFYLPCYTVINQTRPLKDEANETRRKKILGFLVSVIPELEFDTLQNWIRKRIAESPVDISELCQKFSLQPSQMQKVLENLVNKGYLDAIIIDNKIQAPIAEEFLETKPDLTLLKRWQVKQDPITKTSNITLAIKIVNVSEQILKGINLILLLPQDLFVKVSSDKQWLKSQSELDLNEENVVSWTFQRRPDALSSSIATVAKLVVTFKKAGKISSLTRKIDLLLI